MATDPVCGMWVEERASSLHLVRDGRTFYFCSDSCLHQFADPEREARRLAIRLAVAWPLAVAVVALTLNSPSRPGLAIVALLAAVVQFYPGSTFYRGTFDALRDRSWNMDVLIAVGTTAAFAYSVLALLRPGALPARSYFDASALIIAVLLTGRYIEQFTRDRAGSALRRLRDLVPRTAVIRRDGVERAVPVGEVRIGDRLWIRAGEKFPTDGLVRSGRTSVDESLLTGEALPVAKGPGDPVLAASLNGDGAVEVEATGVGTDTLVAQIGRLLTEAEMSRVPLQRTADRIAAAFVPAVLALAVAAAAFWGILDGAGLTIAVLVFVTVAITACPCAFGIATPAAILVGSGRAAEEGVLFRGEDAIERAASVDLVLTDKTGTLTDPVPALVGAVGLGGAGEDELLALAAGLEAGSTHPIARAVGRAARDRGVAPVRVEQPTVDPGRGVRGVLDGRPVALLAGAACREQGIPLEAASAAIAAAEEAGDGWSAVVAGGSVLGILRFRAPIGPDAPAAVRSLRGLGIDLEMVTGDHGSSAHAVAGPLGIRTVVAGATPEGKVAEVRAQQRDGHRVAFVGDGINDAAALAAADVGIAIGTGSDVAREAGQVLLVGPSFAGVPVALGTARRIVARVRGNLAWAIGYNAVLLPVAVGALVPAFGLGVYGYLPILGAVAMGLSSTTVILNSMTLRWTIPRGSGTSPGALGARRAGPGPEAV
jgi:P-type Cu+ transporter